jgi:hypothetical protein
MRAPRSSCSDKSGVVFKTPDNYEPPAKRFRRLPRTAWPPLSWNLRDSAELPSLTPSVRIDIIRLSRGSVADAVLLPERLRGPVAPSAAAMPLSPAPAFLNADNMPDTPADINQDLDGRHAAQLAALQSNRMGRALAALLAGIRSTRPYTLLRLGPHVDDEGGNYLRFNPSFM